MRYLFVILIGKFVLFLSKLHGGGSALPGLVVERISSSFLVDTLSTLPLGVVVISGSNGKTTTTKIVVELLEGQGLKVFTNRSGSNFIRGVIASLLEVISLGGKIDASIAVLELDEAHGVHFVSVVPPDYVLLLNVTRDQLDRFGEIDTIAKLISQIAKKATKGVVLNYNDPYLKNINLSVPTYTFSVAPNLQDIFYYDDLIAKEQTKKITNLPPEDDTCLLDFKENRALIKLSDKEINVNLKLNGIYNALNATAAVALCRFVLGDKLNEGLLIKSLESISPAFGRGESFTINNQPLEIILVKNPAGFRLSLTSFLASGYSTMIAINDKYADGRDTSWLWDVDFTSLKPNGVQMISGLRAYDMALRLQYDEVSVDKVEIDLSEALRQFINNNSDKPKRVFCTYTALLAIRPKVSQLADGIEKA